MKDEHTYNLQPEIWSHRTIWTFEIHFRAQRKRYVHRARNSQEGLEMTSKSPTRSAVGGWFAGLLLLFCFCSPKTVQLFMWIRFLGAFVSTNHPSPIVPWLCTAAPVECDCRMISGTGEEQAVSCGFLNLVNADRSSTNSLHICHLFVLCYVHCHRCYRRRFHRLCMGYTNPAETTGR